MDNERPGEYSSWSSRLEGPGALPEMGMTDKEAAWDKLYDRLKEEKPRRRSIIWLWAAAACILNAHGGGLLSQRHNQIDNAHSHGGHNHHEAGASADLRHPFACLPTLAVN